MYIKFLFYSYLSLYHVILGHELNITPRTYAITMIFWISFPKN